MKKEIIRIPKEGRYYLPTLTLLILLIIIFPTTIILTEFKYKVVIPIL